MVRTLTPTLTAALNQSTKRPVVGASIEDHLAHYRLYQSPNNADELNDACLASDGSIIRVRISRGSNVYQQSFQWSRVTDPTNAAQWASFTTFGGGSNNIYQDSSCAVSNNNGVLLAYVQQGSPGDSLWYWTSTNNGATWSSAPSVAFNPPGPPTFVVGVASCGNNDLFCLYLGPNGVQIACAFYNGSTWGSVYSSTLPTTVYGAGIAAVFDGTQYWLVYSDGGSLLLATYTPGSNTWTAYPPIAPATTSALKRSAPRIQYDPTSGLYTLLYVEGDNGGITGSVYSYVRMRQSSDLQHWSQGTILHNLGTQYGAGLLCTPGSNYIVSMPAIYRSSSYSASSATQHLDVSGAILSYARQEQPRKAATLDIVLDNSSNALTTRLSSTTTFQPIGPNCSLVLSEGYRTGTPPTTSETLKVGTYRIQQITIQRNPYEQRLLLHCSDLTAYLDQVNRYQVAYTNQTVGWLVRDICARAGLFQVALPTTAQISTVVPTFVLQAGHPHRATLNELCDIYALAYFLDQGEVLQFRELSASDSPVWSYQPEIEQLTMTAVAQQSNHIIVTGRPPGSGNSGNGVPLVTGEAYDDSNIAWLGQERLRTHIDLKLTTNSQCATKAAFLLSQEQRAQVAQRITVPANPALQQLDVISVSDTSSPGGTGLSSHDRIIQSHVTYNPQNAEFSQTLHLEGA